MELGLGNRDAILDLVEAVVAGPAHLLVGMVLGDFKFPRHRQRRKLLVFFCLLLRHFRLYLCVHDAGPNAGYCGRRGKS